MDHEFVIWLGDLNYRIDLPVEEAMALSKRGDPDDIRAMLAKDQVCTAPA